MTFARRFRAALVAAIATWACGCLQPADRNQHSAAIVGGISDPNHRYVVAVGYSGGAFCSGTVISKHTVLTAGHCIGGVTKVYFGPTVSGATTVDVVQQVRDPMYADICDNDATYDLGILKLAQAAPTQAAPLLRATLDNTARYVGPSWVWVGYGDTGAGGFGRRRVATFPITLVGPAPGRGSLCMIPETLIYAQTAGRSTCNGDSGGPSFWVGGGVEYEAGVTSSGDNSCMLDASQQRSDQPYINQFIQAHIDSFEGGDPCRSDGVCNESCNTGGQLGDPDCAANHCGADGICAEACVAPRDPDCAALDSSNCGDNGVCDLSCASDPDCDRQCGADGNCIPGCATPDPDCGPGAADAGLDDATSGPGDATAGSGDAAPPSPDAGPRPGAGGADRADTGCQVAPARAHFGSPALLLAGCVLIGVAARPRRCSRRQRRSQRLR